MRRLIGRLARYWVVFAAALIGGSSASRPGGKRRAVGHMRSEAASGDRARCRRCDEGAIRPPAAQDLRPVLLVIANIGGIGELVGQKPALSAGAAVLELFGCAAARSV